MYIYESIQEAKEEIYPPSVKGEEHTVVVSTLDETGDTYPKFIKLTSVKVGVNLYWLTQEEQERLHEQW